MRPLGSQNAAHLEQLGVLLVSLLNGLSQASQLCFTLLHILHIQPAGQLATYDGAVRNVSCAVMCCQKAGFMSY